MAVGAQGSSGSSKNQAYGGSRTFFPLPFVGPFSQIYGGGVGINELLGSLPKTTGLFGGPPVGLYPSAGYPAPVPGMPPGASGMGFGPPPGVGWNATMPPMPAGGAPGPAPGGGPPTAGAPQAQPGPGAGSISYADALNYILQASPNPQTQRRTEQMFIDRARAMGIKPGDPITPDQLRQISTGTGSAGSGGPYGVILGGFPAYAQQQADLAQPQQRFQASGSAPGIDALAGYTGLGFGQLPPNALGGMPNIRDTAPINAPQAYTAQANIAPQGFEQFGQDLYAQQFNPVRRELERQGGLQDRQLADQLANTGLASSGAGVGIQQRAVRERNQQLQAASEDAANRAATQRFGLQFQQELQNAQMRQQTALANAGFDLQAQQANADNVLKGDLARADNYLKAYGLTQEATTQARNAFLQALNLQESDLQRMDTFQTQQIGLLLNNWLQQFGAVAAAGQQQGQVAAGSSKQASGGVNIGGL